MSSPHIINEENSANNSIISSTMHSLKDNTNNINSSTTNVNTYLPRIYNSSSINNLSSTNPVNETSTITSIESSLPRSLLSSKSTTNVIKNRTTRALLTHFEPINEIPTQTKNFYITSSNPQKNDQLKKKEKYQSIYNEIIKNPIWKAASELKFNKEANYIRNTKTNVGKKITIRDYINKTRDIISLRHSYDIKKERITNLKASYQSQLTALDQTLCSLKISRDKIQNECFDKYNSYIKHLSKKTDEERDICISLIKERDQLKKEIVQLEAQIKKYGDEKKGILRWILLQIQLKEHLVLLPPHYYTVIEKEDPDIYKQTVNLIKPKIIGDLGLVSEKERKRIKEYMNNSIFNNAEEFDAEFQKLEKKNLFMLKKLNFVEKTLAKIREEKELLQSEDEEREKRGEYEIAVAQNKLKIVKNNYLRLMYEKIKIENNKQDVEKGAKTKIKPIFYTNKNKLFYSLSSESLKILQNEKNNHNIYTNNIYLKKKGMLYNKIFNVFTTSLLIQIDPPEKEESATSSRGKTSRVRLSEGSEMLEMLEHIEKVLTILINFSQEIKSNENFALLLKDIYTKIDKENKNKKNMYQKELLKEQELIKNKKIEERNKKIYFIPLKKVDPKYSILLKKNQLKKQKKSSDKDLQFCDFIDEDE